MSKLSAAVTVDSHFMLEKLTFRKDVSDRSFCISLFLEPDSNPTNKLLKDDIIKHFENYIQSSSVFSLNTNNIVENVICTNTDFKSNECAIGIPKLL